ncbi:30261_t:CDS:2, partial [Racocetra persica]
LRAFVKKESELLTPFFDKIETAVGMENKNEDERQKLNRSLAYQYEKLKGKEFTWVDGVVVLMNLLYDREKKQNLPPLYSFQELRKEIEDKDHRLSIFFNSIYDAANPFERSEEYLEKLDKRLAFECYLICSNRNSKLTSFKTEMSIFLNSMRTAHEAIDAFILAGVTITSRHMDRKKADIAELHDDLVDGYLNKNVKRAMILNVDDYHNIHGKRTPNTCSTSAASHMTTLLLNSVETDAIPIYGSNGVSIHNPILIDFNIISKYLDEKYMKRMAFTSNEAFSYNFPFDTRLEVLSLHSYDDQIKAREEERKMKDSMLFDFNEQKLKTVDSYVNALAKIANIKKAMNTFKEVFVTKRNDTNSNKECLLPLTTKTKTTKGERRFHLAGLNIVANKKQMLLGFSSDYIPARDE